MWVRAHQHDTSQERWRVAMSRQIGEIKGGIGAVDGRLGKLEEALRAMAPPNAPPEQRSSPASTLEA